MSQSDMRIPVVVGIDVEPDLRLVDRERPEPWRGFELVHGFFAEVRTQLAARTGTRPQFSWLYRLDPQVAETYGDPAWVLRHYERMVTEAVAAGDEVGVHTHAYRWQPARGTWIVDEADRAWVDHCLTSSFAAFQTYFHRSARAHKFGNRWLDANAAATLEALGARVDLTLEPGVICGWEPRNETHTGAPLDCAAIPRRPYRPSPTDVRVPAQAGGRGIWMLPLSTCAVPWYVHLPRRAYHRLRPPPDGPLPGDLEWRATVVLRLGFRPYLFRLLVRRLLAGHAQPYLALSMRADEARSPRQLQRIAANLNVLLSHPLAERMIFVGPEAALDVLGCT